MEISFRVTFPEMNDLNHTPILRFECDKSITSTKLLPLHPDPIGACNPRRSGSSEFFSVRLPFFVVIILVNFLPGVWYIPWRHQWTSKVSGMHNFPYCTYRQNITASAMMIFGTWD